jgi:hypothetical protein
MPKIAPDEPERMIIFLRVIVVLLAVCLVAALIVRLTGS